MSRTRSASQASDKELSMHENQGEGMAGSDFPPRSSASLSNRTGPMRSYSSCAEHWRSLQAEAENIRGSKFLTLTSIPTMLYTPPIPELRSPSTDSPFLRLPAELRLQIYALLVLPRSPSDLIPSEDKKHSSSRDYYDYVKKQYDSDRPIMADLKNPTLLIRTIEGTQYEARYGPKSPRSEQIRSTYKVRADRFRARCMSTTYHCLNNPRFEENLGILCTNKQIHAEAAELLYSSYTFDFDTHVEAMYTFLNDLTPFSRGCIRSVRLVKKPLPYDKEFDRAEWNTAMRYLTAASSNINLRRMEFGIVAGRPGPHGWDRIPTWTAADFGLLRDMDGMQWLQYLLEVKGLQELDVTSIVEHCPPATNSMAMANYIRFSASVETGFAQFLREKLLTRGDC